jgi:hypothetical protein
MQRPPGNQSYGLLENVRIAANKSKRYDSEKTRTTIEKTFSEAFNGLAPFDWQTDVCEALILGLDCVVIAGTGAGKTMPFCMPLLADQMKRKMVIVISPLNALEHDQVCIFILPGHPSRLTSSFTGGTLQKAGSPIYRGQRRRVESETPQGMSVIDISGIPD